MDAIQLGGIGAPALTSTGQAPAEERPGSFAEMLREGLERLDDLETDAKELSQRLLKGEPVELHRVVMAAEQAGLAFELLTAIRNKAVDAYQEVMRMQV